MSKEGRERKKKEGYTKARATLKEVWFDVKHKSRAGIEYSCYKKRLVPIV